MANTKVRTIRVSDELWEGAKDAAEAMETTVTALVTDYLQSLVGDTTFKSAVRPGVRAPKAATAGRATKTPAHARKQPYVPRSTVTNLTITAGQPKVTEHFSDRGSRLYRFDEPLTQENCPHAPRHWKALVYGIYCICGKKMGA